MAPRTLALIILFALTCALVHKPAAATASSSLALHGDEPRGLHGAATGITTTSTKEETAAAAVGDDGAGAGSRRPAEEKAAASLTSSRAAAVPRLKMARRFLEGEVGGADTAAKPSCHSNNVHNDCAPPLKH